MTQTNSTAQWYRLMFDASRLWADAGMVVALRSWRLMAGGPTAERELERAVSEKAAAGAELAGALAGGSVATRKALTVYGKRVRANRKRLA